MQTAQTPVLKDIVLVGAGHAHVGVKATEVSLRRRQRREVRRFVGRHDA